MSELTFKIDCPVCKQSIPVPTVQYCAVCGWQVKVHSAVPNKDTMQKIEMRYHAKKATQAAYLALEQQEKEYANRLSDLVGRHQILKEQYESMSPEYELLAKGLEEVRQYKPSGEIEILERKTRQLQEQINMLSARMQTVSYNIDSPKVTFKANYNDSLNQVMLQVVDITGRYKIMNLDLTIGVILGLNEKADKISNALIVSTEEKSLYSFTKGDSIILSLKYVPPLGFKNGTPEIIHLISNTLSEFILT